MANAPGYLADYLQSLSGVEASETQASLRYRTADQNIKIAQIGHSYIDGGTNNASNRKQYTSIGFAHWWSVLSRGRMVFPMEYVFAVSGVTSTSVVQNQLAAVIATDATAILACMTINDHRGPSTLPFATTKANIDAVVAACRSSGKHLFLLSDAGSGYTPGKTTERLSAEQLALRNRTNSYLRSLHGSPLVSVIDLERYMADPISTIGDNLATRTRDSLHPNQLTPFLVARDRLVSLGEMYFPARDVLPTSNSNGYSVENPEGWLNSNPMLSGNAGTFSAGGATVSGDIATGTTIAISSGTGITITCSKETVGDYGLQKLVISGTPSAATQINPYQLLNISPLSEGTKVWGGAFIKILDGATGVQDISAVTSLRDAGGAEVNQGRMGGYAVNDALLHSIGYEGVYEIPEITVPSGGVGSPTRIYPRVTLISGVPASLTIYFGRMGAKVIN